MQSATWLSCNVQICCTQAHIILVNFISKFTLFHWIKFLQKCIQLTLITHQNIEKQKYSRHDMYIYACILQNNKLPRITLPHIDRGSTFPCKWILLRCALSLLHIFNNHKSANRNSNYYLWYWKNHSNFKIQKSMCSNIKCICIILMAYATKTELAADYLLLRFYINEKMVLDHRRSGLIFLNEI